MAELFPAREERLERSLPIVTPKTSPGSILKSRASNLLGTHQLISDSFTLTLKNILHFEFFLKCGFLGNILLYHFLSWDPNSNIFSAAL